MSEKIDKLAQKTIEEIIKLYREKKLNRESLDKKLSEYNEEVKNLIELEIIKEVGTLYFHNENPEVVITPLKLSEKLYNNSKNIAKEINGILYKSIKVKKTMQNISKKLYEGYGFNDKEVLEAVKVLPKYLQEAIKDKNKEIMKEVKKLKTTPLRIAYKNVIKKMDKLSDEALEKHLETAYHEKMRYYAKRIADTEIHRAMTTKRAIEYLNDEEVEFVKFTMSSRHPKTDICDFYANLDVGYGAGIIPKSEMRTTPLHPHCHCFYAPYYRQVKGKQKEWKSAVNDTMSKFSKREQREILGTRAMLERFKQGEDIEEVFNTIRPKYPIKRYIDVLKDVENPNMNILKQIAPPKEKRQKPILIDTKKLNGIEKRISEIANEVVSFGYRNGLEKCYFLNKKGEIMSSTISNEKLECDITNALKKLVKGEKYIQIHNHFENYSFSLNDIYSFLNIQEIDKMYVVSEQFIFEISKNQKTKIINYKRKTFGKVIRKFIKIYAKKYDIILDKKNIKFIYLIVNKILSKRLNYEFKITKK